MTKTLTQDVFKGAPDWVRSAAVDEDGYAFMIDFLPSLSFGDSFYKTVKPDRKNVPTGIDISIMPCATRSTSAILLMGYWARVLGLCKL